MNADTEFTIKLCATSLEYQQERALHYEIPCRPWEVVGVDVFLINKKSLLCILDYHNKFTLVKKVNNLSADNLVQTAKLIFAEYRLSQMICFRCGYKLHG